jgi:ClpP class serine protease
MKNYTHIKNAVFGQPWAIRESSLDLMASIIEERLIGDVRAYQAKEDEGEESAWSKVNGVAVIPVIGPISKRMNLFSRISGGTSTDLLGRAFDEAMDSDASAVLLHFDSPGGSVLGVPEFATKVFEARATADKPIIALADGLTCSAAYWIGAQCDAVYTTEASSVGSIGVYAKLDSYDRMEKNAGVDSLVIRSHELKGIGAGPITPNQEHALRVSVAKYFDMFKTAVLRSRPAIEMDKVATGLDFIGSEAVSLGLADEVSTFARLIEKYGQ